MINPSLGQQSFKSAATIQLEKLIEKQRLVNIKHQEIQLQQLEAAKTQLAKQIENQKQLQIRWLEQSLKEEQQNVPFHPYPWPNSSSLQCSSRNNLLVIFFK